MHTVNSWPPGSAVPASRRPGLLRRAEIWLDERGRPAWIGATVLGFIAAWPVGVGLLGWSLWTGKFKRNTFNEGNPTMFCRSARKSRHDARTVFQTAFRSSGNTAFDSYKTETLKRLLSEQEAFEAFLGRLREAKDKQEFDRFMEERATQVNQPADEAEVETSARTSY